MDNANSLEKLLPGIISFLRSLSKSGLSDIEQCKLRRFISIIDSWHPPPLPSRNVEALPKINRIKDHAVEDCMSDELYCPVDTESNREDEPESFYVDPDDPDGLSMEVVESDEEESFDPVERDPMYNNLSSPQLPRTASATAATIADCLHRGWVSMKGMMTWNRRYLILVLKSGNVEPPCALLQAYKRDTHKRHVWSIEVNHYDISYQEKDSRPMMKISRQGHESHFIGVDIASLTHWFKVLSTFSKSCQMPPDETSSTNSSNSGQMTIANSEANGDVTTKNAKDTSKSKLQNITTWINRGNKKKTSVADLHLEMSPQFSVAGYVNISYDGKKNYQRRLCAINSESGLLSCYVDNSMSEVERSIPLAGLDLDFCKDKKRPLAIAVYTKGDSRREVVTIEPLDKLSQGNWLEALAKETTVGSHQNGNQEDPNMPSFPAPARPDTAPNLSVSPFQLAATGHMYIDIRLMRLVCVTLCAY